MPNNNHNNYNPNFPSHVNNFLLKAKQRHLESLGLTPDFNYTDAAKSLMYNRSITSPPKINKNDIRILYLNACSMTQKIITINNLALAEEADVIVIVETWHRNNYDYNFPSYSLIAEQVRENTSLGRGGGTAIYVKKTIANHFSQVNKRRTSTKHCEDAQVCAIQGLNFTLWAVYRSPNIRESHDKKFAKKIENLNIDPDDIVVGDFNLATADWSKNLADKEEHQNYLTAFDAKGMDQVIKEPTHIKGGTPDLVYVGSSVADRVATTVRDPKISDHSIIIIDYHLRNPYEEHEEFIFQTIPNKEETVYEDFEREVFDSSEAMDALNRPGPDQDIPAIAITEFFQNIVDKHIKTKLIRIDLLSTMSASVKRYKNKLRKIRCKERTDANHKEYQRIAKLLKTESEKWKQKLNTQRIQKLAKSGRDAWGVMKGVAKPKIEVIGQERYRHPDGTITSTRIGASDVLIDYYCGVTTNEEPFPDPSITAPSWEMIVRDDPFTEIQKPLSADGALITEDVLINAINSLNPKSAPGYCAVFSNAIQAGGAGLYTPLLNLFNNCIKAGHFPRIWKIAWIKSLPKKGGDAMDAANTRPISIVPTLAKLFEICLGLREDGFLETWYEGTDYNQKLPKCQFGFRKRSSCEDNLAVTLHKVNHAVDRGFSVDIILYDYAKAFDTTTFGGMLHDKVNTGLAGLVPIWTSYFQDRCSFVRIRETDSKMAAVRGGCPQGCPRSPHHFSTYIRDLYPKDGNDIAIEKTSFNINNYERDKRWLLDQTHLDGIALIENWLKLDALDAKLEIYKEMFVTSHTSKAGIVRETQQSKQKRSVRQFTPLWYADDLKSMSTSSAPIELKRAPGCQKYFIPSISFGDQQNFILDTERFNKTRKLSFHPRKCQAIYFGKHNKKKTYYMTDPKDSEKQIPVEKVDLVRDLGLWYRVDNEGYLDTKPTFEKMLAKAKALTLASKKLLKGATLEKYNLVYHALIKSQFIFCSSHWFRNEPAQNDKLNEVYRTFFSNIPIKNRNPDDPLVLPETLPIFLRKLQLKRCYKILNGDTILNPNDFWDVTNDDRTHLSNNKMEHSIDCWCNVIIRDYLRINPRGDTRIDWKQLNDYMDNNMFDDMDGITLRLEVAEGAYEKAYENWQRKLELIRARDVLYNLDLIGIAVLENFLEIRKLDTEIGKSFASAASRKIGKYSNDERYERNKKIRFRTKTREEYESMIRHLRGQFDLSMEANIYEA